VTVGVLSFAALLSVLYPVPEAGLTPALGWARTGDLPVSRSGLAGWSLAPLREVPSGSEAGPDLFGVPLIAGVYGSVVPDIAHSSTWETCEWGVPTRGTWFAGRAFVGSDTGDPITTRYSRTDRTPNYDMFGPHYRVAAGTGSRGLGGCFAVGRRDYRESYMESILSRMFRSKDYDEYVRSWTPAAGVSLDVGGTEISSVLAQSDYGGWFFVPTLGTDLQLEGAATDFGLRFETSGSVDASVSFVGQRLRLTRKKTTLLGYGGYTEWYGRMVGRLDMSGGSFIRGDVWRDATSELRGSPGVRELSTTAADLRTGHEIEIGRDTLEVEIGVDFETDARIAPVFGVGMSRERKTASLSLGAGTDFMRPSAHERATGITFATSDREWTTTGRNGPVRSRRYFVRADGRMDATRWLTIGLESAVSGVRDAPVWSVGEPHRLERGLILASRELVSAGDAVWLTAALTADLKAGRFSGSARTASRRAEYERSLHTDPTDFDELTVIASLDAGLGLRFWMRAQGRLETEWPGYAVLPENDVLGVGTTSRLPAWLRVDSGVSSDLFRGAGRFLLTVRNLADRHYKEHPLGQQMRLRFTTELQVNLSRKRDNPSD
jgi:hypothetical protein